MRRIAAFLWGNFWVIKNIIIIFAAEKEMMMKKGLLLFGLMMFVVLSVGASSAVSAFGMPSSVPAWSIYVSFLVCVFIGVLFGYIPAQKAANMDPIEAIRHE